MSEAAGAVNFYTCQVCGGQIITRNKDDGTTPFMIDCEASKDCDGFMYSGFYKIDQHSEATFEWYRPKTAGERKKLDNPDVAEHVRQGGLLLRRIADGRSVEF